MLMYIKKRKTKLEERAYKQVSTVGMKCKIPSYSGVQARIDKVARKEHRIINRIVVKKLERKRRRHREQHMWGVP